MTTIDNLFDEMDTLKCSYSRSGLLSYLFEFAYQFIEAANMPKTQYAFEQVIEYKLQGIVQHATKRYAKSTSRVILEVPPINGIPDMVTYELNKWGNYLEGKNHDRQKEQIRIDFK